jgi:hypothetical protein
MMTHQESVTLWTVRLACVFYMIALVTWMAKRRQSARVFWTLSFLWYVSHILSAFTFQYHWSHNVAYAQTARQTEALFGIRWGGGMYFNYLFTAIWAFDVFWIWWNAPRYRSRPMWASVVIHSFLAFMFFNATVIFAHGAIRWFGLAATFLLGGFWLLRLFTVHPSASLRARPP